jgi:hypothetical protein
MEKKLKLHAATIPNAASASTRTNVEGVLETEQFGVLMGWIVAVTHGPFRAERRSAWFIERL